MTTDHSRELIVGARTTANRIYCADSRHLDMIEDGVVDLVICSPPCRAHAKRVRVLHDAATPPGSPSRTQRSRCRPSRGTSCRSSVRLSSGRSRHRLRVRRTRSASEGRSSSSPPIGSRLRDWPCYPPCAKLAGRLCSDWAGDVNGSSARSLTCRAPSPSGGSRSWRCMERPVRPRRRKHAQRRELQSRQVLFSGNRAAARKRTTGDRSRTLTVGRGPLETEGRCAI